MIQILRNRNEFEYELRSLVMAFYPGEKITTKEEAEIKDRLLRIDILLEDEKIGISFEQDGVPIFKREKKANYFERKEYKNTLKILLYEGLSTLTKKELPWGTLTGVRPTKLALTALEEEQSGEEILQYFKTHYLCSDEKSQLSLDIVTRELDILRKIDYKNGYSVYIGIPFCPTTCLYCSFTSYSIMRFSDYVEEYLKALFQEIDYISTCMPDRKLTTVYIGGGTPTTLNEDQLERLLKKVKETLDFTHVKEFTVEAGRPDSITYEKLRLLKEYGVTRISINPQTMNQRTLDLIGRRHSVEQIKEAVSMARELGHDNINMDLIIGLPGEMVEDVEYTLREIKKLNPENLTVHTLAIKRAAFLNINKEKYADIPYGDAVQMLERTRQYAEEEQYVPYYLYRQKNMAENLENIGYAKQGKECIYNILIMEEKQTILAAGAGASSKFVFPKSGRIERAENVKDVKEYVERIDEMIERKRHFIEEEYYGGKY